MPARNAPIPSGTVCRKSRQERSAAGPWSAPQKKSPRCTCGPTGCRRYSKDVTTPKLPPPPRRAQKRSACSSAEARRSLPSAVTTSAARRLSAVRPCRRDSQPIPPPRVRPPIPVVLTKPPGTARPCACVAASTSPQVAPPPHTAQRPAGSTATCRSAPRSSISPSSQTANPAKLWPPPRTVSSSPRRRAKRRAAATSPAPAQRAIRAGRRRMSPFHTAAAQAPA